MRLLLTALLLICTITVGFDVKASEDNPSDSGGLDTVKPTLEQLLAERDSRQQVIKAMLSDIDISLKGEGLGTYDGRKAKLQKVFLHVFETSIKYDISLKWAYTMLLQRNFDFTKPVSYDYEG